MSTGTETQVTSSVDDVALQMLVDSLPKDEVSGESSESVSEGKESSEDSGGAQSEGKTDKPVTETNEKPGDSVKSDDTGDDGKETPSFDVNRYFEESSEGLIKSEEDFKTAVSKIKEFDALQERLKVLESEKETIFANDYLKKLNALYKEGRSQEQIKTFERIHRAGGVEKIEAKEALVIQKINEGYTRKIAEKIVSKEFGLDKLDGVDTDELTESELKDHEEKLEIANERIKVAAKSVIEDLKKEFGEISESASPEAKALEEAARKKSYEKALEPFVEQLSNDLPSKIELPIDDEIKFTYDLPKDFAESAKQEAKEYFNHPDIKVSAETVQEFVTLKKALYIYENLKGILTDAYKQGESVGRKVVSEEFENAGGVQRPNADVDFSNDDVDSQLMDIASR